MAEEDQTAILMQYFSHSTSAMSFRKKLFWGILILIICGTLPVLHFMKQPFMQQEDWFLKTYSLFTLWSALVGASPLAVRWLSELLALLCLSFLVRLGGLVAAFLLGITFFFQFFAFQAYTYGLLLCLAMALTAVVLQTIRHPARIWWLLLSGIFILAATVLYPPALLLVAALLISNQRVPYPTAAFLIGTALIGVLATLLLQHLEFPVWSALNLAHLPLNISPLQLLQFAALASFAAIGEWRREWVVILAALLLCNIVLTRGTQKALALMILLPLCVIAATTLRKLGKWPQLATLALFMLPSLVTFQEITAGPTYADIGTQTRTDPQASIVTSLPYDWQTRALWTYLPVDRTFDVSVQDAQANFLSHFNELPDRLWYIEANPPISDAFDDWLLQHYQPISTWRWSSYHSSALGELKVTRYLRIPSNSEPLFRFGDQFVLHTWSLLNSVQVNRCQSITVQTWWFVEKPTPNEYSVTLVLADQNGQGVVRTDGPPTPQAIANWRPGHDYPDERELQIPCDIRDGQYPLLIGIYRVNNEGIHVLPATTTAGAPVGNLVYLTTLSVGATP
jgi:hypothetical protein